MTARDDDTNGQSAMSASGGGNAAGGTGLRGKTRWVLFGSLALNLLLIGLMGGAVFRQGGHRQMLAAQGGFNIIGYVAQLPKSRRDTIRAELSARPREMQGVRQQVRLAREGVLSAMTVEPFDRAQFVAAQDRLIAAEIAQRGALRDVINDLVARLTPEERRGYSAWRAKQMRKHGRSDGGDPSERDPQPEPK